MDNKTKKTLNDLRNLLGRIEDLADNLGDGFNADEANAIANRLREVIDEANTTRDIRI